MTTDTTSSGMPPITPDHDALDLPLASATRPDPATTPAIQSLLGQSKANVSSTLGGLAEAVRDVAMKLDGTGAGLFARYVHDAADTVAGWSSAVERRSVDDLVGDARTLVRTSPAVAVGVAVGAGFVVARVLRSQR